MIDGDHLAALEAIVGSAGVRYGTPEKLAIMRAIKQTLDPKGIMNPGKVL